MSAQKQVKGYISIQNKHVLNVSLAQTVYFFSLEFNTVTKNLKKDKQYLLTICAVVVILSRQCALWLYLFFFIMEEVTVYTSKPTKLVPVPVPMCALPLRTATSRQCILGKWVSKSKRGYTPLQKARVLFRDFEHTSF